MRNYRKARTMSEILNLRIAEARELGGTDGTKFNI